MKELVFESGVVTYSINGKFEVSFNPADRDFVERFYDTFDQLGQTQEKYANRPDSGGDVKESFRLAMERDEEMSNTIDALFRAPVCKNVLGDMSPCAFADGFPVWMNLMLSILDEIFENLDDVQKRVDPRIEKYTAKYQKYAVKYHR